MSDQSTYHWLRELGAVRPMAPADETVLVLGKWHGGHYPIEWTKRQTMERDEQGRRLRGFVESWRVFGIPAAPLTKADAGRIIAHLQAGAI